MTGYKYILNQMIKNIQTPKILTISSGALAKTIIRAIKRRKAILYPGGSWVINYVVKSLPEFIFKKLNF